MRTFAKPTVVVSKCLEFDACRYNGDVISDLIVKSLMPYVQFHADQKYLFMAYNQTKLKEMGRIVANHEKRPVADVCAAYEQALYELLKRTARYTSNINVCQHIFGYFKDSLKKEEKAHFLSLLQKYQDKKIPLNSVLILLRSWAIRFEEQYLLRQTYFEPYPEALVEITDSGKGRDY